MKTLGYIMSALLSLRYKVEIKGSELLKQDGGALILPNHQAMADPQIMSSILFKYRHTVPIVTEGIYNTPILHSFFKSIEAVCVADLGAGSRDTDVMDSISKGVSNALHKNYFVLLYPAGQITGQGYEKIFNKKSAWQVVNHAPENSRIIAVRILGLWGSMWSRAWIGKSPNLVTTLLKSLWIVLANLIFFVPRRKVSIEFIDVTDEARKKASVDRHVFNYFLESIYNAKGEDPLLFLKHYFYLPASKRQLPKRIEGSIADIQSTAAVDKTAIPKPVQREVIRIIKEEGNTDVQNINLESNLSLELNIDSLTLVVLITAIENHFKTDFNGEVGEVKTVADLCLIALGKQEIEAALKPSALHVHIAPQHRIGIDKDATIPGLFLKTFTSHTQETFSYDKIMGCSTRKEFFLKVMVVSKIIRKEVKGQHVGIMLPALQSTTLLVMATYMAEKIPVMLNWTVGKRILQHCVDVANVETILTAGSFFDRVRDQLPDGVKEKCIFFEKKVAQAGIVVKLTGLFAAWFPKRVNTKPENVAVILFTSGSESLPKPVPLTHKNILSDLYGAFSIVNISSHEILMGILPPFHSFGFTVLTILPLVSGLKVAYSPDPAANREVLKIMTHCKASILLATPTFLKMILSIASKEDLKSLSHAITGAESLHPTIMEEFKQKAPESALILEGYGITECAPVLTINPQDKQKPKSVGKFITGVEGMVVDLQTNAPLAPNQEGMIMVNGDNVFNGYIGEGIASPFASINGNKYYKTGDLGYIDDDGYLFITGRLKRFIKIAGEMISIPAIENALLEKYGLPDEVVLAVEASDAIEPPQIVLFTKLTLDLTEINLYLKSHGFSNLIKISRIEQIDEIPLLGTGKTDYKVLKEKII
jgi:long-chain-fatty-acid--[acyl-carrier-protein] ligase